MHGSLPFDEHEIEAPEVPDVLASKTLSQVYIDDKGHIIAVFADDSSIDVTELFDVMKQC
jgi:hypothetical protein